MPVLLSMLVLLLASYDAKAELREVAAVRGDEVLIDLGDDDGK